MKNLLDIYALALVNNLIIVYNGVKLYKYKSGELNTKLPFIYKNHGKGGELNAVSTA